MCTTKSVLSQHLNLSLSKHVQITEGGRMKHQITRHENGPLELKATKFWFRNI